MEMTSNSKMVNKTKTKSNNEKPAEREETQQQSLITLGINQECKLSYTWISIMCILIIPILDYLLILVIISHNDPISSHPFSPFLEFLSLFPLLCYFSESCYFFSNARKGYGWITFHFKWSITLVQTMGRFNYISHSWYLKRIFFLPFDTQAFAVKLLDRSLEVLPWSKMSVTISYIFYLCLIRSIIRYWERSAI